MTTTRNASHMNREDRIWFWGVVVCVTVTNIVHFTTIREFGIAIGAGKFIATVLPLTADALVEAVAIPIAWARARRGDRYWPHLLVVAIYGALSAAVGAHRGDDAVTHMFFAAMPIIAITATLLGLHERKSISALEPTPTRTRTSATSEFKEQPQTSNPDPTSRTESLAEANTAVRADPLAVPSPVSEPFAVSSSGSERSRQSLRLVQPPRRPRRKAGGRSWTDRELADARALLAGGATLSAVAEKLGKPSGDAVRKALARADADRAAG